MLFVCIGATATELNKRRVPRNIGKTIELEQHCPRCRKPLRGRELDDSDYDKPFQAWRVCFDCGFQERVLVAKPWTLAHGEAIRTEERRERERLLINEYFRQKAEHTISTFKGLMRLTPIEFERAVADLLAANGYDDVVVTGGPGDLGVDITCEDLDGNPVAVQCKQYLDKPVGSKEMQTFIGMIHAHHGIDRGIYVTSTRFTKPAATLAEEHDIDLIEEYELTHMMEAQRPQAPADESVRELEMWDVMQEESRVSWERRAREERRERIERARRWRYVNRGR